jgi:hypothetical protein
MSLCLDIWTVESSRPVLRRLEDTDDDVRELRVNRWKQKTSRNEEYQFVLKKYKVLTRPLSQGAGQ